MSLPQKSTLDIGFLLFLLFTISYFFRLPQRLPFLGLIRFDFILGSFLVIITLLRVASHQATNRIFQSSTSKLLLVVMVYIIITIPLTQWPGSVLKKGLPEFLKIIVFYIFAVIFITDENKLKSYINTYFVLMLIIIVEPLFLYFTQDRLGYTDYSMGDVSFERLSGTTNNVGGNPNGLASIVAITFPIIFFFYRYFQNKFVRLLLIACLPLLLITLILTGSRSGLLATIVAISICVLFRTKYKVAGVIVMLIAFGLIWSQMGDIHKQRYLSMVDETAQGRESAEGRLDHINRAISMFIEKPLFGYGIGNYREASWNLKNEGLVSHDFYTEVLVELGAIGAIIYFLFIFSIFKNLIKIKNIYKSKGRENEYPLLIANILEVILITQFVFSIFSGGLSYYIWYLLGGVSVALLRIVSKDNISYNQ
jgi:putative inorganic carbon (hco3(-)) transporter